MAAEPISLRAAAEQLGLHYMTVYRYVRTGRLAASKRGGQWFVEPQELDALLRGEQSDPDAGVRAKAAGHLEDRLLAADEPGAWGVVSQALTSGAEPEEIHLKLVIPAMQSIGDRWADGSIDVVDEHQATVIATRIAARLGPRFKRRGRSRGHIVVGLVSGDRHALTTAIIADLLRGRRFEVTDLGADTPAESFIEVVTALPPDQELVAVVISSTTVENLDTALASVAEVRSAFPDAMIAFGGTGVPGGEEAATAGATLWAPDVEHLMSALEEHASSP